MRRLVLLLASLLAACGGSAQDPVDTNASLNQADGGALCWCRDEPPHSFDAQPYCLVTAPNGVQYKQTCFPSDPTAP